MKINLSLPAIWVSEFLIEWSWKEHVCRFSEIHWCSGVLVAQICWWSLQRTRKQTGRRILMLLSTSCLPDDLDQTVLQVPPDLRSPIRVTWACWHRSWAFLHSSRVWQVHAPCLCFPGGFQLAHWLQPYFSWCLFPYSCYPSLRHLWPHIFFISWSQSSISHLWAIVLAIPPCLE